MQDTKTQDDVLFESELSADAPAFVGDHRVAGMVVVPGVLFAELALGGSIEAFPARGLALANVAFHEPLTLGKELQQIRVSIRSDTSVGLAAFTIDAESEVGSAEWTTHASGAVVPASPASASPDNPSTIRARIGKSVSATEWYKVLWRRGLELGPSFKLIQEVWRDGGEILARLVLPEAVAGEAGDYQVHPVMADAALQLISGAAEGDDLFLPFGIDEVTYRRDAGSHAWCHIVLRRDDDRDSIRGDARFLDDDGRVIGEMRGACLRRVSRAAFATMLEQRRVGPWFYETRWVREDRRAPAAPNVDGTWVVFPDQRGVALQFAQRLRTLGGSVVVVAPGATYSIDSDRAVIRPDEREDYVRLLTDLRNRGPVRGVVELGGLDASPFAEANLESIERFVDGPVQRALFVAQSLALSSLEGSARLWIATRGAQGVLPGHAPSPGAALLWGLAKSFAIEHRDLWGGLVDLGPTPETTDAETLLGEIRAHDGEGQVAFREEGRWVQRLARLAARATTSPGIRADATYLVTGAFTGLGLKTTEWLATKGARHLVLVGRRPPSPEALTVIGRLEAEGVKLRVLSGCDVANSEDVSRALAEVGSGLPLLRGIIHVAGVLEDGVLANQPWASWKRLFAPKVAGTWNLHAATRDRELDFFVLYSSSASVLGAAGQANYCAANAFLDAMAHARKQSGLPALAVNWGFWAEVGMAADLVRRRGRAGLDERGVQMMVPDLALVALERALASDRAQVGIHPVDWSRFIPAVHGDVVPPFYSLIERRTNGSNSDGANDQSSGDFLVRLKNASGDERRSLLRTYLEGTLSRILGGEFSNLPDDQAFVDIGLDSMMSAQLRNTLMRALEKPLSPALAFEHPTIGRLVTFLSSQLD